MARTCIILGGGGHAKVVIDCLSRLGGVDIAGILDRDPARYGDSLLGVPFLGGDQLMPELKAQGVTHFVLGLGGVGPAPARKLLFEKAMDAGLCPLSVVHPSAVISAYAGLEEGVQIFPGAIVNAGARIGRAAIVNTGVIIEHDVTLGEFSHAASGCRLAGSVRVERLTFIGSGATVIQGVTIGEQALIGAGSVVLHDVEANARVAGVPARAIEKGVNHAEN